jgi:sugar phosphate isomerase/epimerase
MTKEIGFDSIDIFTDPLDIDVRERRLIKAECDRAGLPIISLACVAVGLIDFNPSVQRFHVERVKKFLDLAYEYEARNVLLVIGEYIWEQRFLDDVNVPAVQANIDVSHMVLSRTPPEALRALKGKACHVHISDCDGRVHGDLPPGRGVVAFPPFLREIKALGIDGAISIELEYSPQPDKILEWVSEAYRATDQLMRAEGLRG